MHHHICYGICLWEGYWGGILEKQILELALKVWLGVFQAGRAGLCVLGEESHGKDTKEWKDTSATEKPNPKDL